MARAGPKKTQRYGVVFKRAAVELSRRPGLQVQAVAEALDIHPFMLSRWRKEFREGRLRAPAARRERRAPKAALVRELRRLQELERALTTGVCTPRSPTSRQLTTSVEPRRRLGVYKTEGGSSSAP